MTEHEHERERRNTGEERLSTADIARGGDDSGTETAAVEPRDHGEREPLFGGEDADRYRARWSDVQAAFVDEPRRAVEDADALVAELMQQLAETFSAERAALERQWDRDGDVSTEDLRVGMQRYRSFFDRLLSA
jgi:hypothetical protein